MSNRKITFAVIFVSLASAGLGWLVIHSGFYSISADESARTLIAYYWFRSGIIETNMWLPLHSIIIGTGFHLLPDLIILPRIMSILFGILTISAAAAVSYIIFKDTAIAVTAAVLSAFLPERFVLSLLPLPEIIYMFFISAGAYFLFNWIKVHKINSLFTAVIMWSIAGMLRYEGWLFVAGISGLLLYELLNKNIKLYNFFVLILIAGMFPVLWILYDAVSSGQWFSFMQAPADIFSSKYSSDLYFILRVNPLYQFIEQNLFSLNLLGAAGIYLLRKNTFVMKWLIVILAPLLILSIISLSGKSLPAHNFWRIPAVWSLLLVPFTAFTLMQIKRFRYNKTAVTAVLFLVVLFIMNSFNIIKVNSNSYTLSETDIRTGEIMINYINNTTDRDPRILIENIPSFEHFHIVLASQEPFRFIYAEPAALVPIMKEKYRHTQIDYFLVKTFSKKRELLRTEKMLKLLELNNWVLFKKQG